MPFLEHLVRRGALVDPSPMMRPWRVGEIASALRQADTTRLSGAERRTLAEVLGEMGGTAGDPAYVAGIGAGLAASSYSRRPEFELRETGPSQVTPQARALLGIQFGPGLLMADGRWIQDLEQDPEFAGEPGHWQVKSDATYGLLHTRYFDFELGSLSRNWGPQGFPGLLVSDWPLSYDHAFLDLGPRRLHLSMVVAQLDEAPDTLGRMANRYFIAHRLAAAPSSRLQVALWQGTIFSGVNRGIDLGFLNPMQFTLISRTQRREDSNLMLGADAQWRAGRFILSGSAFGDDFDFGSGEPFSFAATATAATSLGAASVWLGYTLVSNLAFRSSTAVDDPLIGIDPAHQRYGTGLARNYSDYDELSLRVSLIPLAGLVATPELTLLRQGEGDPRLPFPPSSEFPSTPTFFQGTVERTLRSAVRATFRPFPGATVELTGGIHHITNAGHVVGVTRTRGVGSVTARYMVHFGGPIAP